jgi:hypothetical protein
VRCGRRAAIRKAEQQRDGESRREGDQPSRAPGWPGKVGEGEDGAGAGGADGRNEGRDDRDPEGDGDHQPDRGHREGHRAWAADEAGAGIGEQWCRQPSDRQPCRRREEGDDDVLGEEQSTAATRLGVPPTALSSPTRLIWSAIRAPTSTAIVATRGQAEQPAAEQQGILFVLKHLVV